MLEVETHPQEALMSDHGDFRPETSAGESGADQGDENPNTADGTETVQTGAPENEDQDAGSAGSGG